MVKSIVVYYSKHGYTKEVAIRIADELKADLVNLSDKKDVDISGYDKVIIGSAIYAGSISSKVKKLVERNMGLLLEKRVGLFICCGDEKMAEEQFNKNFPQRLREHAFVKGLLGGEIIQSRLGFFERKIVQLVAKQKEDVLNRKDDAVKRFILAAKK